MYGLVDALNDTYSFYGNKEMYSRGIIVSNIRIRK